MIEEVDRDLKRWAQWVLEPTPGLNLGYGKNILQRIREGKGRVLPSAPSRVSVIRVDLVALDVERWLKTLDRSSRYVVKLFYLTKNLSVEEKAKRLHCSRRALYDRIERLHLNYQQWRSPLQPNSNQL